jgi:SAM-dependent methyltransferase
MNPNDLPRFDQLLTQAITPNEKRTLLHNWYQYVAETFQDPGWMFMNFGYVDLSASAPVRLAGLTGNPLTTCAELYTRVALPLEPRGKHLLEVGCGRGGGALTVMKRLRPASIKAIDYAANAITLCQKNHVVDGLEFLVGDAEAIPFPNETFDGVFNVESSHSYADFDRFVSEVRRVLKPGGRFSIADIRPVEQVTAMNASFARAGLETVNETDITANVLAALRLTNDFKREFLSAHLPPEDQTRFGEFIGVVGSWYYESLERGEMRYVQFLLRK